MNIKTLAIGGMCAALSAVFQIFPVLMSEAFVLMTMLSALPVYVISRKEPPIGLMSFFVAVKNGDYNIFRSQSHYLTGTFSISIPKFSLLII